MRKSILKQYFILASAVVLLCMVSIGVVLLLISSKNMVYDKRDNLLKKYKEIYNYTENISEDKYDEYDLKQYFKEHAVKIKGDIILTDITGEILVSTQDDYDGNLKNSIIYSVRKTPTYSYDNLEGYYEDNLDIVSASFNNNGHEYYLFLTVPGENWGNVQKTMQCFVISAILVIIIKLFIIYMLLRKTVSPLIDMSSVANSYAKGDFSRRIKVVDKNEIGNLAIALNDMATSLENSETIRKSFIANVSHELKTPMTSISGFVDGMLDGTIPKEDQKKYLGIVSQETKRLSRLVASMLNMTKIESGEVELKYSYFNITNMMLKCLLTFEKQIEKKNIEITGLDNDSV